MNIIKYDGYVAFYNLVVDKLGKEKLVSLPLPNVKSKCLYITLMKSDFMKFQRDYDGYLFTDKQVYLVKDKYDCAVMSVKGFGNQLAIKIMEQNDIQ